ncbi:MAG: 50S ribosomal protein L23 [Acholeplasmatales bacterium]|jgi:large subunit ribosomal protein L23|nr:50S ribosomal protein L23 [Acholeplasmatales bacterium]
MNEKFYEIIKEPIITQKSDELIRKFNRYTFKVADNANKVEIRNAVEALFKVTVVSVHTLNVVPKPKRKGKYEGFKSGYKKAIVELDKNDKITAFSV